MKERASLKIFTDGGARGNPGPAALGIVVFQNDEEIFRTGKFLGTNTNNEAEYSAVLESLKWIDQYAQKGSLTHVDWRLDSLLVVEQLNRKWKIKEVRLLDFAQNIWQELQKHSFSYTIQHVPRAQNAIADSLVNQALDQAVA